MRANTSGNYLTYLKVFDRGHMKSRFMSCKLYAVPVLMIGSCAGFGQAAPTAAPTPQAQGSSASESVDEVKLDIAVQDKKHKKVLDLKPQDIVITDNNVPVTLSSFQLMQGKSQNDQLVTMVFDHFEGAGAKTAQSVAGKFLKMLPADHFSFALFDFGPRMQLLQSFTSDRKAVVNAVGVATANDVVRLSS